MQLNLDDAFIKFNTHPCGSYLHSGPLFSSSIKHLRPKNEYLALHISYTALFVPCLSCHLPLVPSLKLPCTPVPVKDHEFMRQVFFAVMGLPRLWRRFAQGCLVICPNYLINSSSMGSMPPHSADAVFWALDRFCLLSARPIGLLRHKPMLRTRPMHLAEGRRISGRTCLFVVEPNLVEKLIAAIAAVIKRGHSQMR